MYLGFLPSQLATWKVLWFVELAWQYIVMTRNNLCIIWISLIAPTSDGNFWILAFLIFCFYYWPWKTLETMEEAIICAHWKLWVFCHPFDENNVKMLCPKLIFKLNIWATLLLSNYYLFLLGIYGSLHNDVCNVMHTLLFYQIEP